LTERQDGHDHGESDTEKFKKTTVKVEAFFLFLLRTDVL